MDNFNTLWSKLLGRCPTVGATLAQQFINYSWQEFQSRREWSFRRRHAIFSPPSLYNTGRASTNVDSGNPTLVTGTNTFWTPQMVGRQIRLGGLLNPYYTIVAVLSPTALLLDLPWAQTNVAIQSGFNQGGFDQGGYDSSSTDVYQVPYQIVQCYYPVPVDFNYFYVLTSPKDGYRLWTNLTQQDLAQLDPQRTDTSQTYAAAFYDYTSNYGGIIGPVIPVAAQGQSPVSATSYGYNGVSNQTYIVQVLIGGVTGAATYQWMRAGQTSFSPSQQTTDYAVDLDSGVQLYWPDSALYIANDLFVINCQSLISSGVPRYELWPTPTYPGYVYPYIYIAKESDLTFESPQLPPFVANRGEVLLEMALASCARWPGSDDQHENPYFNLKLAQMHDERAQEMIWEMERNDEEIGLTNVTYQNWPLYPAPWADGAWQQRHAPTFGGY